MLTEPECFSSQYYRKTPIFSFPIILHHSADLSSTSDLPVKPSPDLLSLHLGASDLQQHSQVSTVMASGDAHSDRPRRLSSSPGRQRDTKPSYRSRRDDTERRRRGSHDSEEQRSTSKRDLHKSSRSPDRSPPPRRRNRSMERNRDRQSDRRDRRRRSPSNDEASATGRREVESRRPRREEEGERQLARKQE